MNYPAAVKHIMVLTGEPSGDIHASNLINKIKEQSLENYYFTGIGGTLMKKSGVDLFFNIDKLSAMGVTEVLMQLKHIKNAFFAFKRMVVENTPDLLIIIDYPGFNIKAAQFAKKYNINTLYYITPKVWAWKESRMKKIKKYIDHAAIILPFEKDIFKKYDVPFTYVGHPLLDYYPEVEVSTLESTNDFSQDDEIIIGLLPGSRKSEIQNHLELLIKTSKLINKKYKNANFLLSASTFADIDFFEQIIKKHNYEDKVKIVQKEVKTIFDKCHLVIAASGTVTLEAAICCIPTIIIYKLSNITYWLIRMFIQVKFVGLANLIANKEVMPELLQYDATPAKLSNKVFSMLSKDNYYKYKYELFNIRKILGGKGASKNTAAIALEMLK